MIRMTEIIATRPNDREGFPSQSFETPTGRLVASWRRLSAAIAATSSSRRTEGIVVQAAVRGSSPACLAMHLQIIEVGD